MPHAMTEDHSHEEAGAQYCAPVALTGLAPDNRARDKDRDESERVKRRVPRDDAKSQA